MSRDIGQPVCIYQHNRVALAAVCKHPAPIANNHVHIRLRQLEILPAGCHNLRIQLDAIDRHCAKCNCVLACDRSSSQPHNCHPLHRHYAGPPRCKVWGRQKEIPCAAGCRIVRIKHGVNALAFIQQQIADAVALHNLNKVVGTLSFKLQARRWFGRRSGHPRRKPGQQHSQHKHARCAPGLARREAAQRNCHKQPRKCNKSQARANCRDYHEHRQKTSQQ